MSTMVQSPIKPEQAGEVDVQKELDVFRAKAEQRYRKLVISAAAGKSIKSAVLNRALADADRGAADFQRHVETLRTRREAAESLRRADQLAVDTRRERAAAEKAEAHFGKVQARADEMLRGARAAVSRHQERLRELSDEQRELRRAGAVLVETRDPTIAQEIKAKQVEITRLEKRRAELEDRIAVVKTGRRQLDSWPPQTENKIVMPWWHRLNGHVAFPAPLLLEERQAVEEIIAAAERQSVEDREAIDKITAKLAGLERDIRQLCEQQFIADRMSWG